MQIKNVVRLACLLATIHLGATNQPLPPSSPLFFTVDCNIPPPDNFHVIAVGASWVSFSWSVDPSGMDHRIRTYRASDNFLLNTTVVPGGANGALISNLPTGTECYSVINTICIDGSHGPNSEHVTYRTLILELIALGFTPGNSPSCLISKTNQGGFMNSECQFAANGSYTPFKISYGGESRQFGVGVFNEEGEIYYRTTLGTEGNSGPSKFKIFCDGGGGPTCQPSSTFVIKYTTSIGDKLIATYGLSEVNTSGVLSCFTLAQGFTIERMVPYTGGRPSSPSTRERSEASASNLFATAAPNPFSESLDVFLSNTTAENINLSIFNLNGQKVLGQQFYGGQEQYSLSTADLSPGFYFLRIEAEGEVQTLKVIKAE